MLCAGLARPPAAEEPEGPGRADDRGRQWPGPPRPRPEASGDRLPAAPPPGRVAAPQSLSPRGRPDLCAGVPRRAPPPRLCSGFGAGPLVAAQTPPGPTRHPGSVSPTCAGLPRPELYARPEFYAQVENYRHKRWKLDYRNADLNTYFQCLSSVSHYKSLITSLSISA
ncbi:basic proline-rich protein-like isoform X2 [Ailuropoda melanoleuca]|uniref:basic proline-rich protein-like isoform X2 n=1 Tax=Ailuropoda melanoleuca TaxID=9646 RepID=UPI001494EAC9|nr:basic proline-rich protein-like isoform X2 [Ailuropoda melanoleuca]